MRTKEKRRGREGEARTGGEGRQEGEERRRDEEKRKKKRCNRGRERGLGTGNERTGVVMSIRSP